MKLNNKSIRDAVKLWLKDQYKCTNIYGNISEWDTSEVTDMSDLFLNATEFNSDIGNWDVSNVITMKGMFDCASCFDQYIGDWNVSRVEDMSEMFSSVEELIFNQDISKWDVSNVRNMSGMFAGSKKFNQQINNWDVEKVENMSFMFQDAESFNQDISKWKVSQVINMSGMFTNAFMFNQNIGKWDVRNVRDMTHMFNGAKSFNEPIFDWDVSSVDDMKFMFTNASNFNQDLNAWDIRNVRDMSGIFAYTQMKYSNIERWDLSNVEKKENMFYGIKLLENIFDSIDFLDETLFQTDKIPFYAIESWGGCLENYIDNIDDYIETEDIEALSEKEISKLVLESGVDFYSELHICIREQANEFINSNNLAIDKILSTQNINERLKKCYNLSGFEKDQLSDKIFKVALEWCESNLEKFSLEVARKLVSN